MKCVFGFDCIFDIYFYIWDGDFCMFVECRCVVVVVCYDYEFCFYGKLVLCDVFDCFVGSD